MLLPQPIIIYMPPSVGADGQELPPEPITISELNLVILDNAQEKKCWVYLYSGYKPLLLWENEEYDSIGDYTQAQVEARVLELFGNNPEVVFANLMPPISR